MTTAPTKDNGRLSRRLRSASTLVSLPPIRYVGDGLRQRILRRPLTLHFLLLFSLYSVTTTAALCEGAVLIAHGIGILQNPPFFIHLTGGVASIPLVYVVISRIFALPTNDIESTLIRRFEARISNSRLASALFGVACFTGMIVFAYNISLGFAYQIDIYDSPRYPWTFATYQAIRSYLYLLCYPLVFTAPPVITYYLFRSLRESDVRYQPFHFDDLGGLRKYFVAVDRPIYAVQCVAVLIALMNYLGWGRLEFAPLVLAVAAPILVTLIGVHLFVHFHRVVAIKRREEVDKLRRQQMKLYTAVERLSEMTSKDCLELLERIEATERLAEVVSKASRKGLQKYFFNLLVLAAPYVLRPLGEAIVRRVLGGG